MNGRRSRLRAAAMVAALMAIVALPVLAQQPTPSPLPSGSPVPLEPSLAAELETALTSPEALAAAVEGLRVAERERLGLAEVDPQLPAILAELEAMAVADLAAFLAVTPLPPAPSADPGPEGSPQAVVPTGFVSAVRRGADTTGQERVLDQASTVVSSAQLLGFVRRQVASFTPSKQSGRWEPAPHVSTESTSVAGRQVARSIRFDVRGAVDRDRLTLIIELSQQYEVPGPTPDAPSVRVSDAGNAILTVDTCPEEDATVVANATSHGTYDVSGGGLDYHVVLDASDDVVADVDDEATIYRREHDQRVQRTGSGSRADGSDAASDFGTQLGWTTFGQGHGTMPASSIQVTSAEGVERADIGISVFAGILTSSIADYALDGAQEVWRAGKCLELVVDPKGRQVDPGSETSITVTIKHKAHDEEVDRPVKAVLVGTEGLEPNDKPVQPPEFTYTATSESRGEGAITFSSVSNRGIAEERTETYTVDQRLRLDAEGTMTVELGGMTFRTSYRARGLKVVFLPGESPDSPPRVSVEGEMNLRGRVRGLLGRANCSGSFRSSAPIDAGPDVSAQLVGEGDEQRLSVHLWTSTPDKAIDFSMRCRFPTGPTNVPHSIQVRAAWPIWSGLGTAVELPLSGGSAHERGSVASARYDSSLSLRDEADR